MFVYNSQVSPNLDRHSPFELAMGRKACINPQFEITPLSPVSGSHQKYWEILNNRIQQLRTAVQKFRNTRTTDWNQTKTPDPFFLGQIVYMYQPRGAALQTGTRKIKSTFVGPLVIYKAISPNLFMLMGLDGTIYWSLVEESRLKAGCIKTSKGNINRYSDLVSLLRTGHLVKR